MFGLVTRRRHEQELAEVRDARRPIDAGSPGPLTPPEELARAREHARALERRLAEMTTANHGCACQNPMAKDAAS
ncbi:hypothetical protein [Streptomyces sp. NPDC056188]|uniref:hypothetical protein n=1 Tax=Streptomyces sp. NPDC056188 TaxID=3345740 RepID=UPI0035DB572E